MVGPQSLPPLAVLRSIAEAALGLGVAYLELSRLGVRVPGLASQGADVTAEQQLRYGPAQAEQMRPLYEITGGEATFPLAAASIIVWQLASARAARVLLSLIPCACA